MVKKQTASQRQALLKEDTDAKLSAIKNNFHFAHISEKLQNKLADMCGVVQFKKGAFIFREQEMPRYLFIIQEGRVKIFMHTKQGRN